MDKSFKIVLVLVTSAVLLGLSTLNIQRKSEFRQLEDGVFWSSDDGRIVAKRVDPDGPGARAGLEKGDVLVLLDDQPVEKPDDVRRALEAAAVGDRIAYQIVREERRQALSIQVAPLPSGNVSVYYFIAAVGVFSLLVGTGVYVRRRGVEATAHFYVLCLFWFMAYAFSFTGALDDWDVAFYWISKVGILFFPPIFLHFALCFPEKKDIVRRRQWLLLMLYVPSLLLVQLELVAGVLFFRVPWGDTLFERTSAFLDRFVPTFVAVMSLAAFAAFVDSNRRTRSITVKKQTRWIVWGTGFGTFPFAAFYALPYLMGVRPNLEMELSVVPLALIPLSFAYAIVKYRLMDVEVLFKRGMVYTLATAAVGALYLAIFLVGTRYLVEDPHSTVIALLSALVVVLLFTPIKSRIQVSIDRLFYRERYDYRQALMAFSRDLNSDLDLDRLSSRLVERIRDTFEVEKVALLVPSESGELRIHAGEGLTEEERELLITEASPLYARLAEGEVVYNAEFDWSFRHLTRQEDSGTLGVGGLQYAFPCRAHGKVVGVMLLGRRWDQNALSSEDMELLGMLSGQATTALENARLYHSLGQKASDFEALKQQSENTIESLEAGILVLDLEGRVVRWNRALEELYGLPRDQALGRGFPELFPEALRATLRAGMGDAWWRRSSVSGISRVNLTNLRDEEKVVKLQVGPFLSDTGETEGSIVILEDVTDRVEMESQLRLHEKMASLGLLAAGVAHEVNTPLTGISSFTQMLQEQSKGDDSTQKLLSKIERQTERASKIVNNLLNFARQKRSAFVPVNLNEVVEDVLSLLEHQLTQSRVQVRLELSDDPPMLLGDENKLQQVFMNLVLNAQDSMPSGGWLTVATSRDGEAVRASLSDTGQGISQEDISRIYDPFFSTKRAGATGTGLGLSITYGLIQEHSGHIGVDSAIGKGTSFELRFPAYREAEAVDESSSGKIHLTR